MLGMRGGLKVGEVDLFFVGAGKKGHCFGFVLKFLCWRVISRDRGNFVYQGCGREVGEIL